MNHKYENEKNIEPPWVKYPGYGPADGFWRQSGEAWFNYIWRPFWHGLTSNQQQAYLACFPAPEEWLNFSVDLNPDFARFLEEADD